MKKKTVVLILTFLIASALSGLRITAAEPYTNYVYDYEGKSEAEPQAYIFDRTITGKNIGISDFRSPSDVFVAEDGIIYIADTGNNRIVILSKDYTLLKIIDAFDNNGSKDAFKGPQGLFVDENSDLYIADTENGRVVALKPDGSLLRTYGRPDSKLISTQFEYKPIRLVKDTAGRMYIVSLNTNQGIIELDENGDFLSFFGAVQVTPSFMQVLRRMLPIESLQTNISLNIPTEYSSVAIDKQDFVFGTVGIINPEHFSSSLFIHRLNPSGTDRLRRNGTNPPMGDVQMQEDETTGAKLTSYLVDVTVRNNGIYAVLDKRMGRVFTYSFDGDLMYVFGGIGSSEGQFGQPLALDVIDGDKYIIADSGYNQLVIFHPTAYAQSITNAIENFYQRKYDESGKDWKDALKYTAKSELVYNGVAKSQYKAGNYTSAMQYYKLARNREGYSKAYKYYRDGVISSHFSLIFLLLALAVLLLFVLYFYLKKRNKKERTFKNNIIDQLKYAFYVIVHPFKGFWELKQEKRGTVLSSTVLLFLLILVFILKHQMTGFLVNYNNTGDMNLVVQFSYILLPFLLWCIANWAITTLIDGEGSFKDIYITSAYALFPLILVSIPNIILSNLFTLDEMTFYHLFDTVSILWTAALFLIGIMTVHQFTLPKTIGSIMIAIVGMVLLVAIVLLLISLMQQVFNFMEILTKEIQMRT